MPSRIILGLFFLCALGVFIPAFVVDFGFHNDYSLLTRMPGRWVYSFRESQFLFLIGRPINAILMAAQTSLLHRVRDFATCRFASFLLLAACAGLTYWYLRRRLPLSRNWAGTLVFCMFLTPPCQIFVTWATELVPGSVTLLVGILSYLILDESFLSPRKAGCLWSRTNVVSFIRAQVVLMVAMLIYPPVALVALVFTTAHIAFSPVADWPAVRRRVFRDLAFIGWGIAAYFVAIKAYIYLMSLDESNQPTLAWIATRLYKVSLAEDIGSALGLLLEIFLISLGGVWHLVLDLYGDLFMLALLLCGGCYLAINMVRRTTPPGLPASGDVSSRRKVTWLAQILILGAMVFIASVAPFLAAANCRHIPGYRSIFVTTAMAVVIEIALLYRLAICWRNTRKAPAAGLLIAAFVAGTVLLASRNVALITTNFSLELSYLRQRILGADLSNVSKIVIVPVRRNTVLIDHNLLYDLRLMIQDGHHATPPVRETLRDRGLDPDRYCVYCLSNEFAPILSAEDGALVIDLNDASLVRDAPRGGTHTTWATFSSFWKDSSGFMALDDNFGSSWQAKGFPQSVTFACPKAGTHVCYQLRSSNEAGEMPKSWTLSSSEDGKAWRTVGDQSSQTWAPSEERSYERQIDRPQRFFRLTFREGNSPDTITIAGLRLSVN
jgi:hypothetical protein